MPLPGIASSAQAPSTPPPITEAELVRRTQQLYDALVPGDKAPWAAYYADDAMSYDEKGRAMDKTAILADVEPMPKGYSGSIKVVHPHAIFAPGVAVLAYETDEDETIDWPAPPCPLPLRRHLAISQRQVADRYESDHAVLPRPRPGRDQSRLPQ